jgi:predicted unusual protein kinase regulating ubiquinone biosynthesis (AarF/ABC1/UbiB family)
MDAAVATSIIEHELGRRLERFFKNFDKVPVAGASIGQEESAWLSRHP